MSRELRESRRLTGPNVIFGHAGPALDLALPEEESEACRQAWEKHTRTLLGRLSWQEEQLAWRVFPGGLSLAFSAPMDALYTACEMNEWAWQAADAELSGQAAPSLDGAVERFQNEIRAESNPPLLRLQRAAQRRGVLFLACDDYLSLGAGRGSKTWSVKELPEAGEVDWDARVRVPIAMITGTNGKTTIVRLLRAMVIAQGKVPGLSSTDWIMVGDEILDRDDWSGPGGARRILRDNRVDIALLETARGGMLRRGLAVGAGEADVVLINNIAEDHLGEWGIQDLDMLADTKFVIRHAGRRVVLNAEDEKSMERAELVQVPITWFSLDPQNATIQEQIQSNGSAITIEEDCIVSWEGGVKEVLLKISEVPMTLNGAARHNLANACAGIAVAKALGLDSQAILQGLRSFRGDSTDNPGRLNHFNLGGVKVLVDFAHNPHGLQALFDLVMALPAKRRLVTLGQAGDRTEEAIRELPRLAVQSGLDRILLKEQPSHLRGRKSGEVTAIMSEELTKLGVPSCGLDHAEDEVQATTQALAWAQKGDVLLLLTLEHRDLVLKLLTQMADQSWQPGDPVP